MHVNFERDIDTRTLIYTLAALMDGHQLSACDDDGCLESEKLLFHRQGAEAVS